MVEIEALKAALGRWDEETDPTQSTDDPIVAAARKWLAEQTQETPNEPVSGASGGITDEMVETAAKAIANRNKRGWNVTDSIRADARAALESVCPLTKENK